MKPELKDGVVKYQEECFQVLHDYWNYGVAENPRKKDFSGFFERQSREFKALRSIARNKGLKEKDQIRFATEKMTKRYGDPEGLFEISHMADDSSEDYPEETKRFYETLDRLLESGKDLNHGGKQEVLWVHMPTAMDTIEEELGKSFNRNILYHQLKLSDRYLDQKNAKRSRILKKPIHAWAFKRV